MRSKNAARNIVISLFYEGILIIFGMIIPRIIISTYGSSINGLTSTINQILQILGLLQAGAVGASIFQMFRPIAHEDYYQVSIIMDSSKRYFRKIGIIFFVFVICATPILAYTKETSQVSTFEIGLSFIILGINGAFYFFYTSWYDILFSSFQSRFYLSIASIIEKLFYYVILFVILKLKFHFIFMYAAVMCSSIIKILALEYIYNKKFKKYIQPVASNYSYKIPNRTYLLCNQIAVQSTDSIPTVIITALYSLQLASVYAVYNLVQNMIKMVVSTVQLSISEVFGNLIASDNIEKTKNVYNLLEFIFTAVCTILCSCAIFLFQSFIFLYTNNNKLDINYIFPVLSILMVSYDIIFCMYMPVYTLSNVYGLFRETYIQAIISTILAIIIGVISARIYWPLVLLGPISYYLTSLVYRTTILKHKLYWINIKRFIRRCCFSIFLPIISYCISKIIFSSYEYLTWLKWGANALFCIIIVICLEGLYIIIYERKEFISTIEYVKAILLKKEAKEKN